MSTKMLPKLGTLEIQALTCCKQEVKQNQTKKKNKSQASSAENQLQKSRKNK